MAEGCWIRDFDLNYYFWLILLILGKLMPLSARVKPDFWEKPAGEPRLGTCAPHPISSACGLKMPGSTGDSPVPSGDPPLGIGACELFAARSLLSRLPHKPATPRKAPSHPVHPLNSLHHSPRSLGRLACRAKAGAKAGLTQSAIGAHDCSPGQNRLAGKTVCCRPGNRPPKKTILSPLGGRREERTKERRVSLPFPLSAF